MAPSPEGLHWKAIATAIHELFVTHNVSAKQIQAEINDILDPLLEAEGEA